MTPSIMEQRMHDRRQQMAAAEDDDHVLDRVDFELHWDYVECLLEFGQSTELHHKLSVKYLHGDGKHHKYAPAVIQKLAQDVEREWVDLKSEYRQHDKLMEATLDNLYTRVEDPLLKPSRADRLEKLGIRMEQLRRLVCKVYKMCAASVEGLLNLSKECKKDNFNSVDTSAAADISSDDDETKGLFSTTLKLFRSSLNDEGDHANEGRSISISSGGDDKSTRRSGSNKDLKWRQGKARTKSVKENSARRQTLEKRLSDANIQPTREVTITPMPLDSIDDRPLTDEDEDYERIPSTRTAVRTASPRDRREGLYHRDIASTAAPKQSNGATEGVDASVGVERTANRSQRDVGTAFSTQNVKEGEGGTSREEAHRVAQVVRHTAEQVLNRQEQIEQERMRQIRAEIDELTKDRSKGKSKMAETGSQGRPSQTIQFKDAAVEVMELPPSPVESHSTQTHTTMKSTVAHATQTTRVESSAMATSTGGAAQATHTIVGSATPQTTVRSAWGENDRDPREVASPTEGYGGNKEAQILSDLRGELKQLQLELEDARRERDRLHQPDNARSDHIPDQQPARSEGKKKRSSSGERRKDKGRHSEGHANHHNHNHNHGQRPLDDSSHREEGYDVSREAIPVSPSIRQGEKEKKKKKRVYSDGWKDEEYDDGHKKRIVGYTPAEERAFEEQYRRECEELDALLLQTEALTGRWSKLMDHPMSYYGGRDGDANAFCPRDTDPKLDDSLKGSMSKAKWTNYGAGRVRVPPKKDAFAESRAYDSCPYDCGQVLSADLLAAHMSECPLKPFPCPNVDTTTGERCPTAVPLMAFDEHQSLCPFRFIRCPNGRCMARVSHHRREDHQANCIYGEIDCPKLCGAIVVRGELSDHLLECPGRRPGGRRSLRKDVGGVKLTAESFGVRKRRGTPEETTPSGIDGGARNSHNDYESPSRRGRSESPEYRARQEIRVRSGSPGPRHRTRDEKTINFPRVPREDIDHKLYGSPDPVERYLYEDVRGVMGPEWYQHLPSNFGRVRAGEYRFGTKSIHLKVKGKDLLVRVGGGYVSFKEYIRKYGKLEMNKYESLLRRKDVRGAAHHAVDSYMKALKSHWDKQTF